MRHSGLLLACLLFAACSSTSPFGRDTQDGPPAGSVSIPELAASPVPRPEPRSRYGNRPEYEVLGRRYRVMDSASGYRETGIASWYGKKFHGQLTSSRETYNMYAMSAAHKTLPLPTYVEVRNLDNDRTIIVRVNDRGPFAHNRIIDLSYAAAIRLGMIETGTAPVEIRAITFDEPQGDYPTSASTPARDFIAPDKDEAVYVQVGAFGERMNAERLLHRIRSQGVSGTAIHVEPRGQKSLYRVRIGPIESVPEFERVSRIIEQNGLGTPYIVSD